MQSPKYNRNHTCGKKGNCYTGKADLEKGDNKFEDKNAAKRKYGNRFPACERLRGVRGRRLCARYDSCAGAGRLGYYNLCFPTAGKEIFDRTVDTGLEHGTVTVLAGSGAHEVTTYRIDGEYEDGRHPKEVVFTSSLAEDLRRRDFTINAMAYNNEEGLVDLFDGIRDLQRKVIRCVGNPTERFSEDALRILRALRFSAQLGFKLDPATLDAIIALAPTLEKSAPSGSVWN